MSEPLQGAVLLYDGHCGFCNGMVQFVLARDGAGAMRFAPLGESFAREVIARHPALAGIDSLVLVTRDARGRESVRTRSDAAIDVCRYIGGAWGVLGGLMSLVPRAVRDAGYDLLARVRYRAFGRFDVCPVPPPKHRARFIGGATRSPA